MAYRFRFLVWFASLLVPASASGQIVSEWVDPASDFWNQSARWSTPSYPHDTSYEAVISADGAAYTVTSNQDLSVRKVEVDSADATLAITGGTFRALQGLHVENGALQLHGGRLVGTRLSTGPGGSMKLGSTATLLDNVTVAGVLGSYRSFATVGTLNLDEGTIYGVQGTLGGSVVGTGEWVLGGDAACANFSCRIDYDASPNIEFGAGVTVRSTGRTVNMYESSNSATALLVNRGTIVAESPNGRWYVERLSNAGVIRVANGDSFSAGFFGNVGELQLGPGGSIRLYGQPHFNLPTTVSNATMYLEADNVTSVAPLQLGAGGTIFISKATGLPQIESTGGSVGIGVVMTPAQLAGMPISGPAVVRFGGSSFSISGGLDLAGAAYDYTSPGYNWDFQQGFIRNGTLIGPEAAFRVGGSIQNGKVFQFRDLQVDVPLLIEGNAQMHGATALNRPVVVDGGQLELNGSWANNQDITVNDGNLALNSAPPALGAIQMNGGRFAIGFATTLAAAEALAIGAPERVVVANSLDLQDQVLNLETSPFAWTAGSSKSGRVFNGQIVGTLDGPELEFQSGGMLEDVSLDSVRLLGSGALMKVTGTNVWLQAARLTGTTLDGSRIDGLAQVSYSATLGAGLTVRGELDLRGQLAGSYRNQGTFTPDIRFEAGASLSGSGEIGNTEGRIQATNIEIVDSEFTIPAGITLVSATQYDSTDRIHAPQTNLRVDGRVLAGYTTTFGTLPTDSWTFEVASLRTTGDVEITRDGRVTVLGGPWRHGGELVIEGGVVAADELEVETGGSLTGWGTVTIGAGGLKVGGTLVPGNAQGQLAVNGDAQFDATSEVHVELRGHDNSNAAAPQFSQLQVAGVAELAGSLAVTLTPAFFQQALTIGDQFEILRATSLTGNFETVTSNFAHIDFDVSYTGTSVLLQIADVIRITGDFNSDGTVDAADYTVWRNLVGQTGAGLLADGNGDQQVDDLDYEIWKSNFGATVFGETVLVGAGAHGGVLVAVPEPTGIWLFVAAALILPAFLRR